MSFYTNVFAQKNHIYHYHVDESGKRKVETVKYKPTLGIQTKKETKHRDIYGNNIGMIKFESIIEMYKWRKQYEDDIGIYGDIQPSYQFISQQYPDEIKPDFTKVKIFNLDVEVYSNEGFPFPDEANHPITAITVQDMYKNTYMVFGSKPWTPKKNNIKYVYCEEEHNLLVNFIDYISRERPDIITGWNTEYFDIPYIVNRAKRILEILDEDYWLKLSPVKRIEQEKDRWTGEVSKYNIIGIQHIDYMRMYKLPKFQPITRESYALNFVCQVELGQEKVEYLKEYKSLSDLYDNNYDKFITYNIRDCELVYMLEQKLKFLELIMTMAFMAKCNFEDAFGSVKIWEVFVFNELKASNMVLAPKQQHPAKKEFPGGYVKEPQPGMKEWLTVWDIVSSYPNQIISFNLSPETLIGYESLPDELKAIKDKLQPINSFVSLEDIKGFKDVLEKYNVVMSANCEFFSKEQFGVFPSIVQRIFLERKQRKAEAKKVYNELQALKDELRELENV